MITGFKTGPKNWKEGKEIVLEYHPQACEIWFQIDKADSYKDMLSFLQKEHVTIGLHHWGLANGNMKTNLATNNKEVREQTIQQIKDTIDIGAEISCGYVNAHPGAEYLERIDFATETQSLVEGSATPPEESKKLLLEAAVTLQEYAKQKGVLLTIETLPGAESFKSHDRSNIFNPKSASLETMADLAKAGTYIANDITHTSAALAAKNPAPEAIWRGLQEFTANIFDQIRLLHANTMIAPFNGTDSHHGLLEEDFAEHVFPAKLQVIEFLRLFKGRNDVFAIPEPREKMKENYAALQELINNL